MHLEATPRFSGALLLNMNLNGPLDRPGSSSLEAAARRHTPRMSGVVASRAAWGLAHYALILEIGASAHPASCAGVCRTAPRLQRPPAPQLRTSPPDLVCAAYR